MSLLKYFTPAAGLQIPNLAAGKIVPPEGMWVTASSYWHRRVAEGSGELADQAPPAADNAPAPAPVEPPPGP
jgi:hypothetical protein